MVHPSAPSASRLERLPPTPPLEQAPVLARPSASTSSSSAAAAAQETRSPAMARPRSPSASAPAPGASGTVGATVWGLALVGFDHTLGPTVEFTLPAHLHDNPELQRTLPFLALPDGAHARDEDYSYFHLVLPALAPDQTIFGISCNRQIPADQLLHRTKDVTRSTVQKAIVVLASKPIFGPLRDKLGVVTRSFFAQRNFDDKAILVDLFRSLNQATADPKGKARATPPPDEELEQDNPRVPNGPGPSEKTTQDERERIDGPDESSRGPSLEETQRAAEEEGGMYMGTSLRELVHRFRFKTLMLLKLLMLQRRVMFFAATTPVEQLCTFQYSLVTLIPGAVLKSSSTPSSSPASNSPAPNSPSAGTNAALLTALDDAASPALDSRSQRLGRPSSLKTSDKYSLIRYLGLPLNIFGKGSFFQPYLPLQQIDLLQTRSFLVGTTNSIFQQQRDCHIDVLVNIDSASLEVLNPKLTALITLTAADRKWMDELVTTVDASWNAADPGRPLGEGFIGSDDFLRAKFEEYVCSLLACVKFGEFLARERGEKAEMLLSAPELEAYNPASFNEAFINAFKHTRAFEQWDRTTDEVIFDLVEPKHPMEGKTNPIEDVGIRLVHGLHDFSADLPALAPHLAPLPQKARERLSRGWTQGRDGVWGAVEAWREDWGKRQQQQAAAQAGPSAQQQDEKDPNRTEKDDTASITPDPPPLSPAQPLGGTFLPAGVVDVARTGAQQLAAGLGGFLGGAARKTNFFGGGGGAGGGSRSGSAGWSSNSAAPNAPAGSDMDPASSPPRPRPQTQGGGSAGSFLRPLSTAGAATVPTSPRLAEASITPSPPRAGAHPLPPPGPATSSSSSASPAPSPVVSGLTGFFGGLRRIATPSSAGGTNLTYSASSSTASGSIPSTPVGASTPPPSGFLGVGGWGGPGRSPDGPGSASASSTAPPQQPLANNGFGAGPRWGLGKGLKPAGQEEPRIARDVAGDLGREYTSSNDDEDDDNDDDDRDEDGMVGRECVVTRQLERIKLDGIELSSPGRIEVAREEARRRLEGL